MNNSVDSIIIQVFLGIPQDKKADFISGLRDLSDLLENSLQSDPDNIQNILGDTNANPQ